MRVGNLKSSKLKWPFTEKPTPTGLSSKFIAKTLQIKCMWDNIFKIWKGINVWQPGIFTSQVSLSEIKNKYFPKNKGMDFFSSITALEKCLERIIQFDIKAY